MRKIWLLLLFFVSSGMTCPPAADILKDYHFTVLKPPSTLYFVGAIVAVDVDEGGNLETGTLRLVCGPRSNLGSLWSPISSHTVTQQVRESSRSKWTVDGEAMEAIKAKASLSNVESIEVTLKNARIMTMSDTDLLENIQYRTPDCQRAIMARLNAGHSLTIISAALVADLDYSVHFKQAASFDKRVRAKQLSEIAVTLGGGHTRMSEKTIESRGLALGIKTDSFLMALSVPELGGYQSSFPNSDRRDEEDRTIPLREAATSTESDSALTLPGGSYVQPIADF